MSTNILSTLLLTIFFLNSCGKKNDPASTPEPTGLPVEFRQENTAYAPYKVYLQEQATATNRKGIIILAHGDGGTIHDATLNGQSQSLAEKGYIAITTTYRPIPGNYVQWMVQFKQDMEALITKVTAQYGIPRNKVVIGGLSRGGNLVQGLVLPGQMGAEAPITGIKGVILECAGGDQWKGSAILFPVLYMSNATDPSVGTDAEKFKIGLQTNNNTNVKALSKCLIIPGNGHCTNAGEYKGFILNNIDTLF
jgi:hypothetical protein